MSGGYSGLQARLKEENKYAEYIPCAGHSLNLVGVKDAECTLQIIQFFSLVQKLYTYFSLESHKKVVKSLSDTRWSARNDAIDALHDSHVNTIKTLDLISNIELQSSDTRLEAISLQEKLMKFENVFLLIVWKDILTYIHSTNLSL